MPTAKKKSKKKKNENKQENLSEQDLKIAYLIGIDKNDKIIFDIFGTDQGIVQLTGLHKLAESKIKKQFDQAQQTGDALTVRVGDLVIKTHEKLDHLISLIQPTSNKISK